LICQTLAFIVSSFHGLKQDPLCKAFYSPFLAVLPTTLPQHTTDNFDTSFLENGSADSLAIVHLTSWDIYL